MEIKFFTMELANVTDLKTAFYGLVKKHHPDVAGGSNEDMKQIIAEYEYLFKNVHELGKAGMTADEVKKDFHSLDDNFREQIIKVAFLDDIIIEIIGSWVWVSGNTSKHYDIFKGAGFKWSGGKKAWYWYNGMNAQKYYRHAHCKNLNEVKKYHAHSTVNMDKQKQLASV